MVEFGTTMNLLIVVWNSTPGKESYCQMSWDAWLCLRMKGTASQIMLSRSSKHQESQKERKKREFVHES